MKTFIPSLLLILLTNMIFGQSNNCCDSLVKTTVWKSAKKICCNNSSPDEPDINNINCNAHSIPCKSCIKILLPQTSKDEKNKTSFEWNDLLKNCITIFIALIAGFIALYQMKLNLISSARIRWIEDLKTALSDLYPAVLNTAVTSENHKAAKEKNNETNTVQHNNGTSANQTDKDNNATQYYSEYIGHLSAFNALSNKIKMQLNSNEIEHKIIEDIIDKIDMKLDYKNIDNISLHDIESDLKQIVTYSKIVFKKEWKKSKRIFKI